ncbi:telomerase inhibitor [Coccidioides posadasii str. Silveira]|uniref:Protein PXR1 n=1 Tax=Coccidioides posadasii (strain RMSCC 757 / Silveira) TaxID=443226 RepID=E9DGY2_COCPS|nr:G-patch RNA maturation protein [Coccidioides posadasii str. Silveira]QVM13732.1 telomerase inhibitor [Coccidioides posadasii str. Silveira]
MGLAGPKKRTKISHDPNNIAWSRSTTGYGHRIMSAQGWTPGAFLGAPGAAHSSCYTAASASHIRVVLKDDTLGLGARPRNPLAEDEPTGLDAFQDLLGRLNGKSDVELVKEQRRREDIKLLSFVERRWKSMAFVPGGYLVKEDPARTLVVAEQANKDDSSDPKSGQETTQKRPKKEKRKEKPRHREEPIDSRSISSKSERGTINSADQTSDDESTNIVPSESKSRKKEKKKKPKKRKMDEVNEEESLPDGRIGCKGILPNKQSAQQSTGERYINGDSMINVREHRPLGRQVIRSRYIQQKKMALLDAKSLNEIFMTS